MAASDGRPVPKKNVAFRLSFDIRKNTGVLIEGWTGMETKLSKDGGNFADATNEATEIQTSGTGYIDITADEMNCDTVIVKITVTNADALPFVQTLYPTEDEDIPGVTLADNAIAASKYDESTAFPLSQADNGWSKLARAGYVFTGKVSSETHGVGTGTIDVPEFGGLGTGAYFEGYSDMLVLYSGGITVDGLQGNMVEITSFVDHTTHATVGYGGAPSGKFIDVNDVVMICSRPVYEWIAWHLTYSNEGIMLKDEAITADKIAKSALAKFVTEDTEETSAVDGSVAQLAQGSTTPTEIRNTVWGNTSGVRSLTNPSVVVTTYSTSNIVVLRGDTFAASITGLGSLALQSKIWFTVKNSVEDADTSAVIQITEADGLLRLNGVSYATPANGSLTIDDEDAGDISILVKVAAFNAVPVGIYSYDVQMLDTNGLVSTLCTGTIRVVSDVTKAVS